MKLSTFPRPAGDNGRGMHWSPSTVHPEGEQLAGWIDELQRMNVKWVKLLDDGEGSSLELCRRLVEREMMPVVRLYRTHPNPGGLDARAEEAIRKLVDVGAAYFETNNEPDLPAEWQGERLPRDWAQLVVGQCIADADRVLALGGLPAVPALSVGNQTNLISLIVSAGRADLFARGAWLAVHAYTLNHPPEYPLDDVTQAGALLTREAYDRMGAWAWDEQPRQLINLWRRQGKTPGAGIGDLADGWRAFELADQMARDALGYSVPVLATEGGAVVGWRDDRRYPRVTPELHREWSVAINQFMQAEAPAYFFTTCHWLLANFRLGHHVMGWESQCWFTDWWESGFGLRDHLPAVDAVREMPSFARRLAPAEAEIHGSANNAAGEGVYGVPVVLLADGQPAANAITNARGRFRFTDLPAGQYELRAEGWLDGGVALTLEGGVSQEVQLALQHGRRSVLRGRALTPGGAALAGVGVTLADAAGAQTATTDAAGRFAFSEVAAGVYTLSAGEGRSVGVALDGWATREADIIVPPAPGSRFRVVETRPVGRVESAGRRVLFGTITDESHAPLDGVRVELRWPDAAPATRFPTAVSGSDPSQPAGYYEFPATPGRFSLSVAEAGAQSEASADLDTAGAPDNPAGTLAYEVSFQRQPAESAGWAGRLVISLPGIPPAARVTLVGEAAEDAERPWRGVRQGDDFTFDNLPAGRYRVQQDGLGPLGEINLDGFNRNWLRLPQRGVIEVEISAEADAGRLRLHNPLWGEPRELAAQPGQTLRFEGLPAGEYQARYLGWRSEPIILDGEGSVTLAGVRGGGPRQASLAGRLLNADGEPMGGRRILLLAGGEERGEQRTDGDGRYQFSCLSQGVYALHVEGAGVLAEGVALDATESRWLDLAAPQELRAQRVEHYLLLAGRYAPGAWAALLLLLDYIRHKGPLVGFDWREALTARRVTIVGDAGAQDAEIEKRLLDAGCLVQRLPGDLHLLADALARELR
jgi:hypothetical protein